MQLLTQLNTPNLLPKLKEAGVVDARVRILCTWGFEKSVTDPEMLKDLARAQQTHKQMKTKIRIYK